MSDPLELLPYAIAVAQGRVHQHQAPALIAAGLTLLQRSASLVRALASGSPAIVLPHGPAFVTALGACDGHAALLLDPDSEPAAIAAALRSAGAGVIFTVAELASRVPSDHVLVLLDDVPREAQVRTTAAEPRRIDLGSHVGLTLEGNRATEGSELPVLRWMEGDHLRQVSHRELFIAARLGLPAPVNGIARADVARVMESLLLPLLRGGTC